MSNSVWIFIPWR